MSLERLGLKEADQPIARRSRSIAATIRFQNPLERQNQSERGRRWWGERSAEEKNARLESLRAGSNKARESRMRACFGEHPEQVLQSLVQEGLSAREIATKANQEIRTATIQYWLTVTGLKTNKTTTLDHETVEHRRSLIQRAEEAGLMQHLPAREASILQLRYGPQLPPLLKDVGNIFGVSKQSIAQTEARAITILKKMLPGEVDTPKSHLSS